MNSTEQNTGLWQLYVFSAVLIMYSIVMYGFIGDPCMLVFGDSSCNNGAEAYLSRAVAVGLLYVGTFYASLIYINQSNPSKLRRLSNMCANCAMALLVSIIFIGSKRQGGLERSLLHFGDLILCLFLVAILLSPTCTTSEMASSNPPLDGFGMNPKSFLLFIGAIIILKVVVMSEFVNPLALMEETDSETALSHILWLWLIVIIIILLFPIVFAVVYGDRRDQEVITGATVAMIAVSWISFIPTVSIFKPEMVTAGIATTIFCVLFAIATIFVSRSSNQHEYDEV